jgi:undecaprenyl-phosphate 4-deoxy-4-formamido-L-arabinose transferase
MAVELSVVIPVYNSGRIVCELHSRLSTVLQEAGTSYEIVFVNDCSPDDVWVRLVEIAAGDPQVKAVCLRKNVGYDNAIMAGFHFVEGDFVIIMDDDLQHAPEDIPILLSEIRKGHDVVYANFEEKRQSPIKNFGSWLNGKLAQLIIKKPPNLYLSPFKIIRREIVSEIVHYNGPFPYIDGLIFQVTSAIHQVPIEHHSRVEGEGGHGILRSLKIMMNFSTTFSVLPLRVSTAAGFLISMTAGIVSMGLVFWKIFYDIEIEGWTSIILCVIVMGGIQLTGMGLIGEYIGRAYMKINSAPQYVIRQVVTCSRGPRPGLSAGPVEADK